MADSSSSSPRLTRRCFFAGTLAAAGATLGSSLEERCLAAAEPVKGATPIAPVEEAPVVPMPMGKIGSLNVSRLICGGNLISGFAHSRDLIYVSPLLKQYFTDERIFETWRLCERHGINSMITNPRDVRATSLYRQYRERHGGKIQWLAQLTPSPDDLKGAVSQAMDNGAHAIFLLGNLGDRWVMDGRLDLIEKLIGLIKDQKVPAGVAGHAIETPLAVEEAGIDVDFYMKTHHSTEYWSKRQADQHKAVIDNYSIDNYWDMEPERTVAAMKQIKKPWIAYKVLAAGALRPKKGFEFAFRNGADFACVGMFDFQIAEDATVASQVIAKLQTRERPWA